MRRACSGKETGWASCLSFKPYSAREGIYFQVSEMNKETALPEDRKEISVNHHQAIREGFSQKVKRSPAQKGLYVCRSENKFQGMCTPISSKWEGKSGINNTEKDGILQKPFVPVFTHHQASQVSQVHEHLGGMRYFINGQGRKKILYSVNCKLNWYLMQGYVTPRHLLIKCEVVCYLYKFVFLAYNMLFLETRP